MTTEPATTPHMCVGPTCRECGEPTEVRHVRQDQILPALFEAQKADPGANHHVLARAATASIREDILHAVTSRVLLDRVARLLEVTHAHRGQGGHDNLGQNLTCSGCALAQEIREHLREKA